MESSIPRCDRPQRDPHWLEMLYWASQIVLTAIAAATAVVAARQFGG
jgi:hypothetical protein